MCDSYDLCESHSTSGSSSRAVTHSRRTKVKRTLEELNLIDAFLFSASTEKIQNAELVARIIVEAFIWVYMRNAMNIRYDWQSTGYNNLRKFYNHKS